MTSFVTSGAEFVVDGADGEAGFATAGSAAEYLLEHRFADPDREPHWHLRWCLDRMEPGESMDVGGAYVVRGAADST